MSIYSKLAVFIILFTFLVGCKAKSPTSSSSDDSSSTSTDTGTDTDTGTGTTSYVGKWVKSNDNSIAMDWKSDSFVYSCLVSTYTYAAHGSYSGSNSRLTMWDGSYATVSSSGSNFILGSATYIPATLYSTCNPFWTNSTSENTYYTNASRSIGYWKFTFTIISTWTDYQLLSAISTRRTSDSNYYNYGTDENGNVIVGTYKTSTGFHDVLDDSGSIINKYFVFTMNSSNSGISSGCYFQYSKSDNTWSSCFTLTAQKIFGTPRTYRNVSKDIIDEMLEKRVQEQMIDESLRNNRGLTENDLRAFKRYKQLLRIHNQTVKNKSLKKYLQSFRTN
jgi:hypothetical protein